MSLRAYFPTDFASGDVFERKEDEVSVIDETSWESTYNNMDLHHHYHHHGNGNQNGNPIESDQIDFWPVEHPMEPQDEDRPVKCPMPASSSSSSSCSSSSSSSINIDGKQGQEERIAAAAGETCLKRSEVAAEILVNKGTGVATATEAPVRAVRKRHHTLTRDDQIIMKPLVRMPPLPPNRHNLTIFQMLQEFHKFNS